MGPAFTEGRTAGEWLEHLYADWRAGCLDAGRADAIPGFDEFWQRQRITLPRAEGEQVLLADFRRDPARFPLPTESGRIEITCARIASFGYVDCPGHPVWLPPDEWRAAERFPLHLIANQPATRLHSQLDVGAHSRAAKIDGREPVRMHPHDAADRGLIDGQLVRVHNDRGSCVAGLVVSDRLRPGVVQLSTGAWYDPDDDGNCRHGNPNVLTADRPTSSLSQACAGQHALVEVSALDGPPEPITVTAPPPTQPARA